MLVWARVARLLPVVLVFSSALTTASAREKSDVLILRNGDHVTGEIVKLERGMLTLKTDSMGTVEIKWEDITRVTSRYLFTVEDSRGQLYFGSLEAATEQGGLDVIGPEPVHDLEHLSVVGIRAVEGSLWTRFSGSVELGYTFTKASDRTQFNLNSLLAYRAERFDGQFAYDSILSSSQGEQDADRTVITLLGSRYVGKKWLLFAQGKYEHNLELQLEQRGSLLAGPGYKLRRTNRSEILLAGGASYTRERYFNQSGVNNAEGAAGINAQFFKLYSPKVDVAAKAFVLPNLTTLGRVRLEFDSELRLEVFKDFFVTFNFYDSFDSQPPSETATKNDYGFVTGVSWSFRR